MVILAETPLPKMRLTFLQRVYLLGSQFVLAVKLISEAIQGFS